MCKRIKKITIALSVLLCVMIALTAGLSTRITPPAGAVVVSDTNYDNTAIEDDLADIDLEKIKADYNDIALAALAEYCYSDNVFKQGNYGLYLYVYNPERKIFSTREGANMVNIAVSYNAEGQPDGYANKPLKYLGKTTGDNDGLFYKFKIIDVGELLPLQKEYNKNYGCRCYNIAGLQLRDLGSAAAKDYGVSVTYRYTGYAKGYGEDGAVSTLDCEITELETLRLNVKSTFYRPNGFNGEHTRNQDQLNSVYFSVPDGIIERYGGISEIHADWYEYRTKPVFVTGNKTVYAGLKNYIGQDISLIYDSGAAFSSAVKYGFAAGYGSDANGFEYAAYGYNLSDYYPEGSAIYPEGKRLTRLDWLFNAEGSAGDRNVTSAELISWAEAQSAGKTDLIQDKYSRELFTEDVGIKRRAGYNDVHIQSDTQYDLRNYNIGSSFWDKLFGNYTSSYAEVKAIEAVTEIPSLSDSGKLYVDDSDMDEFITYVNTAEGKNETTYLFRFALTDYYSVQAYNVENINRMGFNITNEIDRNAYLCAENVFMDFDIIDVTFYRDGVYTVIPAVSDPIDIFPDTESPPDFNDDKGCADGIKTAIMVVLIVLGVIIVIKMISWIVRQFSRPKSTVNVVVQGNGSKKRKKRKRR